MVSAVALPGRRAWLPGRVGRNPVFAIYGTRSAALAGAWQRQRQRNHVLTAGRTRRRCRCGTRKVAAGLESPRTNRPIVCIWHAIVDAFGCCVTTPVLL